MTRTPADPLLDLSSSLWTARLLVAASVGPYGAHLADGSECTGRYGVGAAVLRDLHGPRLELLAAAGPDLDAVETVPGTTRRRSSCLCSRSWACRRGSPTSSTRAGALRAARAATGLPGVAYPNAGERWDPATNTWSGAGHLDVGLATGRVEDGARLVGGCCQVGPEQIRELRATLS